MHFPFNSPLFKFLFSNQRSKQFPPPKPIFMSLNPPLRHGWRRTCHLFWCYQCHRTVRVISYRSFDVFCPRCYGHFLHEVDFPRPQLPVDYTHLDPSPVPHFLDSLSAALGLSDSRLVFRGTPDVPASNPPVRLSAPPPIVVAPPENSIPPTVHPGDYFVGPGLNELIAELTQDDLPGPPPAPVSAIDAMPTVGITNAHLAEDGSQCPVCKEEFALGEEAREMPCKHVYHSECIVPWLRLHNSCPVCRYKLPNNSSGEEEEDLARDEVSQRGETEERRRGRWNPLSLLWAFWPSSLPNWVDHAHSPLDGDSSWDAGGAFNSWWRSWFLL